MASLRLADIARTSREVAEESSRLAKRERLVACLRGLAPGEARLGVALLCGVLPEGRLGVGPAALRKAAETPAAPAATLTLAALGEVLAALGRLGGPGSGRARERILADLFARATAEEQAFLAPWLAGALRQGASEGAMLDALAAASGAPPEAVRRAAMLSGDLVAVGEAALVGGASALAAFRLTLFRPVLPMLAQPAEDVEDALARLGGRAALELKLDGARVQVHRRGDDVRVYSRRRHDVTAAVPEIAEAVRALPARELVLDGEAIALAADGRPHPFQVTMRRFGRRADVERLRAELPLSSFFFDCLWRDGESLLERGAAERADVLAGTVPAALRVERRVTARVDEARSFLARVLERGHEGLVAKALGAPYEAGRRGGAWLKLKTAHTLDLVVLAAEWGSGRRRGWLSNLHLGARDAETDGFAMLGKTFKGLGDALLAWQTRELLAREVRREGPVVHVRPELVVEVAFSDVQTSPHYASGLALRFARVRRYREDKGPEEADTLASVRALAHDAGT